MIHEISRSGKCAVLAVATAVLAGCASVNPHPDYDRTARGVEAATGGRLDYRPGDDEEAIQQRVQELLRDGLTVDEAMELCLLNNRTIQAALLEVGAARADVVQAGLPSNPSLSFGLRFPDSGGLANFETALAQNLADLWQIPTRRRVAEELLEQAVLRVAREISVRVHDTRKAYYLARQADRKREIAAESLQIARQVLDLAIARQQAGAGSEVDVNLAKSETQDARLAMMGTALEATEARVSLCMLLSVTMAPETLDLRDTLPEPAIWEVADEALLKAAAAHRLDVQAAARVVEAAKSRIAQERLKVFPTFELGVSFERAERQAAPGRNILADSFRASVDAGEPTVDLAPKEHSDGQDTILGPTLGMELPIFNHNQGGIARARFEYEQSRRLLEKLLVQVHQEVRLAGARARNAWGYAGFYRDEVLPLRETSLSLARTAYQAGHTSLLNVLEAERALLNARLGYAESLQASASAVVELESAIGCPVKTLLDETPSETGGDATSDTQGERL